MNVAMRLMQGLGALYREEQNGDGGEGGSTTSASNPASFNPSTTVTQTTATNVDMRAKAEEQQRNEEEHGSLDGDNSGAGTDGDGGAGSDADSGSTDSGSDSNSESSDAPTYQYGGVEVTITNKPEMVEAFKEKGLDIDAVNVELYSKDGLTQETRSKLEEAFGKASVDMYLEGWKNANDSFIETHNNSVAAIEAEVTKITDEVTSGKLDDVLSWANDNLSADEYKQYQEKINGDDMFAMRLALQDLTARSGVVTPLSGEQTVTSSVRKTAVNPTTSTTSSQAEGLSQAEYQALFKPNEHGKAEYWSDPKKYDALRDAGRAAGL